MAGKTRPSLRTKTLQNVDHSNLSITDKECIHQVFERYEKLTTADVVEVKHGEWVKTDRGIRTNVNTGQPMRVYYCDCSCCGWHTGHQGIEFKYCPNCGVKMDGERK